MLISASSSLFPFTAQTPLPAGAAVISGQGGSWELSTLTAISLVTHYESVIHKCLSTISELYSCSGSYHLLRLVIQPMICWLHKTMLTVPKSVSLKFCSDNLINKLFAFFIGLL